MRLQATGLRVRLRRDEVLHGIDLHLEAGEWLGVIGPNGAGKSTLLKALAGVLRHTGTLEIGSGPRATQIALMPQAPLLPEGMSVVEYVLLGRTAHLGWLRGETRRDRRIAAEVIGRLRLDEFVDRPVTSLSGGEAQRAVVARALAQQTQILLLDEPTSALDLGHQAEVLSVVDELRRQDGISVIAAMHDLGSAARYADRLQLLAAGSTAAVGTPTQVLDPDVLTRVYRTPLDVHQLDGEIVVLPRRAATTGRNNP
ncbi:MAG: ABC transporter ATP-binding protein [Nocardioides sp.]